MMLANQMAEWQAEQKRQDREWQAAQKEKEAEIRRQERAEDRANKIRDRWWAAGLAIGAAVLGALLRGWK